MGAVAVAALASCAAPSPPGLGLSDSGLARCPSTLNCVSSQAYDEGHAIPAMRLAVPVVDGWRAARAAVAALPRTRIVSETRDYLHAECSSALFGYVDDLELHLRSAEATIEVRSASRVGRSDIGVNRRRVDSLRSTLAHEGVIQAGATASPR